MPSAQLFTDLRRLNMSVRMGFMDAYNAKSYTPRYPIFATTQQSSSAENIYPQIIDPAAIREWVGERVVNGLVINGARVANQTFELTYAVRRTDVEDDLTGTIAQAISRVRSGASKFVRHPDKLVMTVLTGNSVCLDGLALFHASHKENPADAGSATYANTASGTLTPTNAAAARSAMMELRSADGDVANENPNVLIVPPALETVARKIANADMVIESNTGTDNLQVNVYKGAYTVVVAPQLSTAHGGNDAYWYMADANDPEDRGVIYQDRDQIEVVSFFNPADESVFTLDEYKWGMRKRHTAAGGNPKKIFRRTG
jgi:phage major head subunit gpT-like protein